ncbi:MAG: phosphotransferase family protein [SAR86 cluster bacterium]|nr:phosphotransferase family protein [SAR86 cluster bacterium]
MPESTTANVKEVLNKLTPWFEDRLDSPKVLELTSSGGPEDTGFSNETLIIKASYIKKDIPHEDSYVLRVKPTGFQVFPEYDLDKQVLIMNELYKLGLPTPEVVWNESSSTIIGSPFYLMRYVEGTAPPDSPPFHMDPNCWVARASIEQKKRIWWEWVHYMSEVHLIDLEDLQLSSLDRPELGERPLDQEIQYYRNFMSSALPEEEHKVCEDAFAWLEDNKPTLDINPISLVWGDCRCGNILYKDFKASALLDWEMAILGDPVMDLSWGIAVDDANSLGLSVPRLEGFPEAEETIEVWVKKTGYDPTNYFYYRILALQKFSIVMIMTSKKMIINGVMPEDSDYYINNHVTQYMTQELEKHG